MFVKNIDCLGELDELDELEELEELEASASFKNASVSEPIGMISPG